VNGTGLIRRPSSRLAEGIVTHISRTPVDVALALMQHAAYAEALAASGWMIQQAPIADDCPDSVFIEDAVVICEDLAVLTRPGAPARRAEVAGVAQAVRSLGLRTVCIEEPGTLDGGDVLQVGTTVYVGRGGRTNGAGIRQLRTLLAALGRTVIAVPLENVLHLKSAVTALPDGTFLLRPGLVPAGLFPAVRTVGEEGGSHVVPLGGDRVLISASAPRTAELLEDLGFTPVVVDISEFEKLEVCVTCLSVLLPERYRLGLSQLLESRGKRVQPLRAFIGHLEQFPGLDAGAAVAGDDVGLHDQGHAGRQGEVGLGGRPARRRHHRREIAAPETVHQVVGSGEACLLDEGGRGGKFPGASARDQLPRDRVERGGRDSMEFGVQGRGRCANRERAEHLAGVLRRGRCTDLAGRDVATGDHVPGRPLGRHAQARLVHGGDAQVVDVVQPALRDICVLRPG